MFTYWQTIDALLDMTIQKENIFNKTELKIWLQRILIKKKIKFDRESDIWYLPFICSLDDD